MKNGDSRTLTSETKYFASALMTLGLGLGLGLGFYSSCGFNLERQLSEETEKNGLSVFHT